MSSLRIAIVKPDWGIRGGFEIVLDRLITHLEHTGHRVDVLAFDVRKTDRRPYGVAIPEAIYGRAPEFFSYLEQFEISTRIDTHRADLVISTQPPSFAVDHPRHLSVFYHHHRQFYDLAEPALRAGLISSEFHGEAQEVVRRIDGAALAKVTHILAGSETVRERLRVYSGRRTGVSVFHAGPSTVARPHRDAHRRRRTALCISRHNFPKRTELFVHAMHLTSDVQGVMVGAGGRLGFVRRFDRELTDGDPPAVLDPHSTWLNAADWIDPSSIPPATGSVEFRTDVSDDELEACLDSAFCLVAPALLEDYGLTAIEAMQAGVPVITCNDSGNLTEFVEDGVTGLIVEPTGAAIAQAVQRLANDPDEARTMGEAARDAASHFNWERALREFDAGIEAVLS